LFSFDIVIFKTLVDVKCLTTPELLDFRALAIIPYFKTLRERSLVSTTEELLDRKVAAPV
jgi:hypothetical protein